MPFTHGTATTAAGSLAVALAEEVSRAMFIGKIKVGAAMILIASVLVTGLAAWVAQEASKSPGASPESIRTAPRVAKAGLAPPAPEPERLFKRAVQGIVRDEQGRPVAGAWIGDGVEPMPDVWTLITLPDRIRVAREPYRDQKGSLIAAGSLGKVFEYRDDSGQWQPVHPDDIRRFDRSRSPEAVLSSRQQVALEKVLPHGLLEVRLQKDRRRMSPLNFTDRTAARTDSNGRFTVEASFSLPRFPQTQIQFASPDLLREAVHVVRVDGPDRPLEITSRPTRWIRSRVIETPKDHPEIPLWSRVFSLDAHQGNAYYIDAISGVGVPWANGPRGLEEPDSPSGQRRFEVRLPAGRYKAVFDSSTVYPVVDLIVPAGEGPIDMPDIQLKSLAWVNMLGEPAAEIDAVDLEGKPVKLADYRGKVVLLAFWSTQELEWLARMERLAALHQRLEGQPLTILAIHDASVTSVDAFKAAARAAHRPVRQTARASIPAAARPGADPQRDWSFRVESGRTRLGADVRSLRNPRVHNVGDRQEREASFREHGKRAGKPDVRSR